MHCGEPNCICDEAGKQRNSWPVCHYEDTVNGKDNRVTVRWKHVATPASEPKSVLDDRDCSRRSGDEASAAIAWHVMRSAVLCPLVE